MNEQTFPCANQCGRTYRQTRGRKTQLCQTCSRVANGKSESKRAKCSAIMKAHMQDPAFKAASMERSLAGWRRKYATDTAFREKMQSQAAVMGKSGAGLAAQGKGSEARRLASAARRKTLLGWCPAEYLPAYRTLVYSKRVKAADARALIEQQMQADHAKLSPFEQQLAKIRAGHATISEKFIPRPADHAFTLGGVASGMI